MSHNYLMLFRDMLLGVRCYEPRSLGASRFHAGNWPVLVHVLVLLAILEVLKSSKAPGPSVHCSWV